MLRISIGVPSAYAREISLSDDDLLIVAVNIGRLELSTDFFVYYQPDFTLVPLQSFCDVLDFSITVDPDGRSASGWFQQESQTFNLNLENNSLYIAGEKVDLNDNVLYAFDDFDILIGINQLSQWFNLNLELITSQLQLKVSSSNALPIEQRLNREKNRKTPPQSGSRRFEAADVKNHYRLFSLPVFDAQAIYSHDEYIDSTDPLIINNGNQTTVNTFAYNIEAGGDLLYHQMALSVNADDSDSADSIRFSLSRRAKDYGETIGLGMTDYSVGDVFSDTDNLVNKGSGGVGLRFQRQLDGGRESNFTQKLIEGDAPAGWEVELYRNGILIDFQVSDSTGRYRFEGANLQFGENVFDIKIYGPQGQERSRRERVHIGKDMIKPKQWSYRGLVMKENSELFSSDQQAQNELNKMLMVFDYGLSKSHSASLGFTESAPSNSQIEHQYVQTSLLSAWEFMSTQLELVSDTGGGEAAQLALSTRVGSQDITLKQRQFSDFISQQNPNGAIESQTELIWSSYLQFGSEQGIPLNMNIERVQFNTGATQYSGKALASSQFGLLRFNNELSFSLPDQSEKLVQGVLNIGLNYPQWRARSKLSYNITPNSEFRMWSTTIDWQGDRWRIQVNADLALHENETNSYGLNISRKTNFGSVSVSAQQDEQGLTSGIMSVEFSMGLTKTRPWHYFTPNHMADKGRVRTHVFLDHNGNNLFESDIDEPLANVGFSGRPEWKDITTDDTGRAELSGFSGHANTRLTVEEKSFGDPYLRPRKSSLLVSHHGGGLFDVAIPVQLVTDVEGYVWLEKNAEVIAAGGVTLHILDQEGSVLSTIKTEFDGYYYATGIPAGSYQLVLEDRIQQNPDYTVNTPIVFDTNAETGITQLGNIVIKKLRN